MARDSEALAELVAVAASASQADAADACCRVADEAFKMQRYDVAFAVLRAGLHTHCFTNDTLCKRYVFRSVTIVKGRMSKKTDGPPEMLLMRELFAALPAVLCEQLTLLGGPDAVKTGERCVLYKESLGGHGSRAVAHGVAAASGSAIGDEDCHAHDFGR